MDQREREEFSELRREQKSLQDELAGPNRKLQDMETRLVQGEEPGQSTAEGADAPVVGQVEAQPSPGPKSTATLRFGAFSNVFSQATWRSPSSTDSLNPSS